MYYKYAKFLWCVFYLEYVQHNNIFKVGTVLTGITGFILAIILITQEQSLNNYPLFFIALFTISKDAREFVFYVIEGHPVPHNNLVGIK